MISLLKKFPIDMMSDEEIHHVVKYLLKFGYRFGYVAPEGFFIDLDYGKEIIPAYFQNLRVLEKTHHKDRFEIQITDYEKIYHKNINADEDYEFRTGTKPDARLPVLVDTHDAIHVIESMTIHLRDIDQS